VDPDPEQPALSVALALIPALISALFGVASVAVGSLSGARRAALRETLRPSVSQALDRYILGSERVEARWLWLRVLGIATTAGLITSQMPPGTRLPWLMGILAAVAAYALPTQLLRPLAVARSASWAPRLLRTLAPFELLVAPLADPISWLARKWAGSASPAPSAELAETEVEMVVAEGEQNGSLSADASAMIRNVLEFRDVTAEDVMVPRIHVDALDAALSLSEAIARVAESRHSRYPVYSESVDNIVGILHVKDLYIHASGAQEKNASAKSLGDLARRPVAFVPETQPASTVLKDMRAGRHHLAVVVDEFGGFSGIVTLEDLLEEIVGDIQDEHDVEDAERFQTLESGNYLVDASLPVADVNRYLGVELPEGDYVSIGGLLMEHLGEIPRAGTEHELHGLRVKIREADARHIALIEIELIPPATESSRLLERSA
jgi:CBS domain containing-hemolysin-like protein